MRHIRSIAGASSLVLALLVAGLLAIPTAAGATETRPSGLRVVDLGTLGGPSGWATDINEQGDVVGESQLAEGYYSHAFLWRHGRMTDLGTLGGEFSGATAINNRGEIAGYSQTAAGETHTVLWRGDRMTDLGTLGGLSSRATDINDRGEIIGLLEVTPDQYHSFLWRNGRVTEFRNFWVEAINNRGQVVGSARFDGGEAVPAIWDRGVLTPLEQVPGATYGSADSINARGAIAGFSGFPSGVSINRAFLWRNGVATTLPEPAPWNSGHAWGINDHNQVVGVSWDMLDGSGAVLWDHGTPIVLSNLEGAANSVATAINNHGQIAGSSTFPGMEGITHPVVWR
jgi:probable HAF family extracellular repeat protein